MPQGQISKTKNRNNVVTNSIKALKIVHIKIFLIKKIKTVKLLIKADKNLKIIGKKKKKQEKEKRMEEEMRNKCGCKNSRLQLLQVYAHISPCLISRVY